jgi:hypothetical protein
MEDHGGTFQNAAMQKRFPHEPGNHPPKSGMPLEGIYPPGGRKVKKYFLCYMNVFMGWPDDWAERR